MENSDPIKRMMTQKNLFSLVYEQDKKMLPVQKKIIQNKHKGMKHIFTKIRKWMQTNLKNPSFKGWGKGSLNAIICYYFLYENTLDINMASDYISYTAIIESNTKQWE